MGAAAMRARSIVDTLCSPPDWNVPIQRSRGVKGPRGAPRRHARRRAPGGDPRLRPIRPETWGTPRERLPRTRYLLLLTFAALVRAPSESGLRARHQQRRVAA